MAAWSLRKPEPQPVIRFDYDLPKDQQFSNRIFSTLSVSPDGRQFVYSTNKGLYLRSMVDELNARCISNADDNPVIPFFSPDGKWVGYLSGASNKLKKVAISGAGSVDLCEVRGLLQASWSTDDTIIYTDRKGLMRISVDGGIPEKLIEPMKDETIYNPQLLPDGKSVMFTLGPVPYRIAVVGRQN